MEVSYQNLNFYKVYKVLYFYKMREIISSSIYAYLNQYYFLFILQTTLSMGTTPLSIKNCYVTGLLNIFMYELTFLSQKYKPDTLSLYFVQYPVISQYFGRALYSDGPTSIEQQLKLGSDGVSMTFIFLIDLVVLWLRLVFSYFFLSAQLEFLQILSGFDVLSMSILKLELKIYTNYYWFGFNFVIIMIKVNLVIYLQIHYYKLLKQSNLKNTSLDKKNKKRKPKYLFKSMLDSNLENQPVQYQRSSDIQPEELISFISLPHYQLHKLINDPESFIGKVSKLNNEAKSKIQQGLFKESLLLLNQAQKILQYAAGSGKNIDRDLIVSVLHNLSCTYRNLWIMPKCSTYIQGLLFNLDNQISSLQSSISSAQINQNSYEKTSTYEIKKSLALYQLKFLATNSQLKQHKIALNSGKKALLTLKDILLQNQVYIKRLMKQQYEIVFQNTMKPSMPLDKKQYDNLIMSRYTLLTELLNFSQNIDIKNYKNLIKAAHFSYQIFTKQKILGQDHPFSVFFKKYSIGDVMELKPLLFPLKNQVKENWKLNNRAFQSQQPQQSLIYKFILLSITFFSIGTQMRLLLTQEKQMSDLAKQNDQRFRQSDIYHLLAIITITSFVPFEILYLKHLLNSYKVHYNSDFFDYKTVQSQSISKIIYLISGKKYDKITQNQQQLNQNEYHLKQRAFDKIKTEKHIQTVRKIKPIMNKSKDNKKSFKTISFLQNKSTVIEKDYPNPGPSKSKSNEKNSKNNKSKSKLKKKSKDMSATIKKEDFKKLTNPIKRQAGQSKSKKSPTNIKNTKSRSKSKKKSLSKYQQKTKGGSNSSSNKDTYFASKQIGLSSILQNGTKSKLQKQKQGLKKQTYNNGLINGNINIRKVKSTKNLKQFISSTYGQSKNLNRQKSNQHGTSTSINKKIG